MTTTNRAALLNKIHKVLKRTYKHAPLKGEQPVLETLLFACCLENTRYDVAQATLAKLRSSFFDWNEIRVTTVRELAEVLEALGEPVEAATRLKGVLQGVFESDYTFDLESLKKQNIGVAIKRLEKLPGASPYGVAYVTQSSLGGHSIPIDKGALNLLYVLGVVSEVEAQQGNVPGMERAIPKSKGQEFGALLHELAADFFSNPFSPALRELLLSIASDAKERFPKRQAKKPPVEVAPAAPPKATDSKKEKDKEKAKPKEKEPSGAKKQTAKVADKHDKPAPKAAAHPKKRPSSVKKVVAKTISKRKPR